MDEARRRHSASNCAVAAEWNTKPPPWKYTTTGSWVPPSECAGKKRRTRRWSETAWSEEETPAASGARLGGTVRSKSERRRRLAVPSARRDAE
jgi:hypothetical protein